MINVWFSMAFYIPIIQHGSTSNNSIHTISDIPQTKTGVDVWSTETDHYIAESLWLLEWFRTVSWSLPKSSTENYRNRPKIQFRVGQQVFVVKPGIRPTFSELYEGRVAKSKVRKSGSFLLGIYEVYERLSNEINNFILQFYISKTRICISSFFLKINRNIFCQRRTQKIKLSCFNTRTCSLSSFVDCSKTTIFSKSIFDSN